MPDPNKLKKFVDQDQDQEGGGGGNPDDDFGQEELADPEDDTSEEAQNARKMNPQVAYMELSEEAGAFSCGTCTFGTPSLEKDEGTCIHELVRATVSTKFGCCNFFHPAEAEIVFPPHGGGGHEEEEEESEEEEHEEEGGGEEEEAEGEEGAE